MTNGNLRTSFTDILSESAKVLSLIHNSEIQVLCIFLLRNRCKPYFHLTRCLQLHRNNSEILLPLHRKGNDTLKIACNEVKASVEDISNPKRQVSSVL